MALLFDEEVDPGLQDWQLMAPDAPISSALRPSQPELPPEPQEPRKLLDVSRGAPAQSQPRQDGGGIDALKQAMAQARQNRLGAELGMAGQTIANAFVPQKSSGFWERQLEGADRPVQELQARQKMQGEEADRRLKEADRAGKSAYTQALQQQITANMAAKQQDAALAKDRADYKSQVAQDWRAMFALTPEGKIYKEQLPPEQWERLTPAGVEGAKSTGDLVKSLRVAGEQTFKAGQAEKAQGATAAENEKRRKQEAWQNDLDRQAKADIEAAKALAAAAKPDKSAEIYERSLHKELIPVEVSARGIDTNLAQLDDLVDRFGTKELIGSAEGRMRQLLNQVSTLRAKLTDPSSAAMFGEVQAQMANLWNPDQPASAYALTKQTARELIASLRDLTQGLANTHYEVRGIPRPSWQAPPVRDIIVPPSRTTRTTPPKAPPPAPPQPTTPPGGAPAAPAGPVKMRFVDPNTKKETIRLVQPGDVEKMKQFGEVVPNG